MSTIVVPHLRLALAQCQCGCLFSSINMLLLIRPLIGQQENFKIPQCECVCVCDGGSRWGGNYILSKRSNKCLKPLNYLFLGKALVEGQVVIVHLGFYGHHKMSSTAIVTLKAIWNSRKQRRRSFSEVFAITDNFWLNCSWWAFFLLYKNIQNAKCLLLLLHDGNLRSE